MFRIAYIAAAVSALTCAAPVFAQDAPSMPQPTATAGNDTTTNAANNSGVGMDMSGQTAAGSPAGLTRAEVKRELYQSEQDGELKRLDRTIYNGGS
jgi:hypothetical protein